MAAAPPASSGRGKQAASAGAAGLRKPDISILSDAFLAEVRGMPRRNLAVELLRKLLDGEIRSRSRRNLVQARSFAELLEQALRRYQNRAIADGPGHRGADRDGEGASGSRSMNAAQVAQSQIPFSSPERLEGAREAS